MWHIFCSRDCQYAKNAKPISPKTERVQFMVPRSLDLTQVAFWVVTASILPTQVCAAKVAGHGVDRQSCAAEVVNLLSESERLVSQKLKANHRASPGCV